MYRPEEHGGIIEVVCVVVLGDGCGLIGRLGYGREASVQTVTHPVDEPLPVHMIEREHDDHVDRGHEHCGHEGNTDSVDDVWAPGESRPLHADTIR